MEYWKVSQATTDLLKCNWCVFRAITWICNCIKKQGNGPMLFFSLMHFQIPVMTYCLQQIMIQLLLLVLNLFISRTNAPFVKTVQQNLSNNAWKWRYYSCHLLLGSFLQSIGMARVCTFLNSVTVRVYCSTISFPMFLFFSIWSPRVASKDWIFYVTHNLLTMTYWPVLSSLRMYVVAYGS